MGEQILKKTEDTVVILQEEIGQAARVIKKFLHKEKLLKELRISELLNNSIPCSLVEESLVYPYFRSLHDFVNAPLPEPLALDIMRQGVGILAELKEKKLVHRDLKPGNFYIDVAVGNKLYLGDFETVQELGESYTTTCGTLGYMSPEQFFQSEVDWLADQYSLGAIFYFILTGVAPFQGENKDEVLALQQVAVPNPSLVNGKLKQPFCQLVEKMMSLDKEDRYSSISELYVALDSCSASLQRTIILEDKVVKLINEKKKSNSVYWQVVAIVLIALILAGIAFEIF